MQNGQHHLLMQPIFCPFLSLNSTWKVGFPPFFLKFHPFWFPNLIFSLRLTPPPFWSFQNLGSVLLKARGTHVMQQLPLRRERYPGLKNIFFYWSLFYRAISFHFPKWGHFSSKSWRFHFIDWQDIFVHFQKLHISAVFSFNLLLLPKKLASKYFVKITDF